MVQAPPKPELAPSPPDVIVASDPVVLRFPPGFLTDQMLLEICHLNEPWEFERNPEGALEIAPPPGTLSGRRGSQVSRQIINWAEEHENGEAFAAGAGFHLESDAVRDPDAAWVSTERLQDVEVDDEGYWQVCPELIVEVRSRGQAPQKQHEKMLEWIAAGARLGWLLDPFTDEGVAFIYRDPDSEPERLERPGALSGEDVAEGLTVDLAKVWR